MNFKKAKTFLKIKHVKNIGLIFFYKKCSNLALSSCAQVCNISEQLRFVWPSTWHIGWAWDLMMGSDQIQRCLKKYFRLSSREVFLDSKAPKCLMSL